MTLTQLPPQLLDSPVAGDPDGAGAVGDEHLRAWQSAFASQPAYRLAQNALTRVALEDIVTNHQLVAATDNTFSTQLDEWGVTNQQQSGRCWLFAGLNLLRFAARRTMDVKEVEFSQAHLMFWDKVERANYFLEAIIETADRPSDDRTVDFLLSQIASDGGQWNMFVSLVKKYGLVPKAVMPETESSAHSRRMNASLRSQLRQFARELRARHASGAGREALRALKQRQMERVYRMVSMHLGTPPERFTWQWRTAEKNFQRTETLTPQQFAARFVDLPLDEYVCLVHDPRPSNPTGRTYTVEYLGNVLGGDPVTYLNVEMPLLKQIAQQTLEGGEPVWFGCDMGKQNRRDLGLMDRDLFDFGALYDADFSLDKAGRLEYGESRMTHAMLFTGVDVVSGQPRRWRVENSWGADAGQKGFFTMSDTWFDEYLFEIAARRSQLPPELQAALDQAPRVLPAWDPMGALAC